MYNLNIFYTGLAKNSVEHVVPSLVLSVLYIGNKPAFFNPEFIRKPILEMAFNIKRGQTRALISLRTLTPQLWLEESAYSDS